MQRFRGQALRDKPHIAVFVWDKLGNVILATVVLRALRERYPACTIDLFSGERTRELEEASALLDARFSLIGLPDTLARLSAFVATRIEEYGPYDLGINLDFDRALAVAMGLLAPDYVVGDAVDATLRRAVPRARDRLQDLEDDLEWNRLGLVEEYRDLIRSQYLAELWCRKAGLETDFSRPEVPWRTPSGTIPDILLATGGTRSTKLWSPDSWRALVRLLRDRGITVGLVGVARAQQAAQYGSGPADDDLLVAAGVEDLRGRWTLPEVAGATRLARAVVTIDNAIGHLAAAMGAPTVILWGGSPWRLWGSPLANARHILPARICLLCEQQRFRNASCLRPEAENDCLVSITPERALREILAASGCGAIGKKG
ncbi:MAG: glycosyltransferase family 9 protein [Chloroflexi bacterium]|nr:glycosyltransferase family 9 protein [Chloroflexota bacterium]